MTKLLILSRYDRQGASSRLRTMQYVPHLQSTGVDVEISPLFNAAYLHDLYSGKRQTGKIALYYLARLRRMLGTRPDVIWLEKEAFPWLPWALEKQIWPSGIPIISDYDDALFHRYDQHSNAVVKRVLGRKIDKVMAHSAVVIAGNSYLAARAATAGAKRIEIVPTVVDVETYQTKLNVAEEIAPCIGWIGTPETWKKFGRPLFNLVQQAAQTNKARFRIIGSGEKGIDPSEGEFLDWTEASEVRLIQGMDVGIMPLEDTLWARGKCGYKLIQYMACGLPVVASPVGVNREIVEHGVNGYLAETEAEWTQALTRLVNNYELRRQMGAAGRKKVEEQYSLQVQAPKIVNIIHKSIEENRPHALER